MPDLTSTIYVAGSIYGGGQAVIDDLKGSGFTNVIAWTLHISETGDLSFNDTPLVSQGQYLGDPDWPALLADLTNMAEYSAGTNSVQQLGFGVGSWGAKDFENIQHLIATQGTGPDSILYQNFSALKQAIPALNYFDMDDESNYDQGSMIAFCEMLFNELGFYVTFCPYTNQSFWVDCFAALTEQTDGLVLGLNLQCYAGGTGNDPGQWIQALADKMGPDREYFYLVWPGLASVNGQNCDQGTSPTQMQSQFLAWNKSASITGGFVWRYDDIQHCQQSTGYTVAEYGNAVAQGYP